MTVAITEHVEEPGQLRVSGALTIYEAPTAKITLLELLTRHHELIIDLADVDEIDTAGVQVLYLTKREGIQTGKPVRLIRHSEAVQEALTRLNLMTYFDDALRTATNASSSFQSKTTSAFASDRKTAL